jgi:predicted nucleic acid-binding protein
MRNQSAGNSPQVPRCSPNAQPHFRKSANSIPTAKSKILLSGKETSGKTAPCRDAIEAMLLDTNILIYACQPGGDWLSPWTTHTDAAIASVTQIEALGFPGISPEEETALLSFIQACPSYPLADGVIQQAIKLRQQKKMKLGDAIIAATALEY